MKKFMAIFVAFLVAVVVVNVAASAKRSYKMKILA